VVELDGVILRPKEKEYFLINKPKGSITTLYDPQGRITVMDFLKRKDLFPVGRLDKDTRGLLIITNDGELANRILHPRYEVERRYIVTVRGRIDKERIDILLQGINLDDGPARFDDIRLVKLESDRSILEVSLHEGRKRLIRRIFCTIGNPVLDLVRVKFGPVELGDLKEGKIRPLTKGEIESLKCL
jgi:23S rRNA pseudouridine2605 synthase